MGFTMSCVSWGSINRLRTRCSRIARRSLVQALAVGSLAAAWAGPAGAQEPNPCGPASGKIASQAPAQGLCASGSPSPVAGPGPWSWSCGEPGAPPQTRVYCAAPTTAGLAQIPDSRFEKYVKFFGDIDNHGTLATQARVNDVVTKTEQPFFIAGFFRAEDYPTWGMLAAVQSNARSNGVFALSLANYPMSGSLFEWRADTYKLLARMPNVFRNPARYNQPTPYLLDRWTFIAVVIRDHCNSQIFLEGLWSDPVGQCVDWPSALSSTTFGSYYDITHGAGDAHVFNGGLRDWAVVMGVPTSDELLKMRAGVSPLVVWGQSRVWGYWSFTADPSNGAMETDLSGRRHALTYIGAGSVDSKLPRLVVSGARKP